MFSKIDNPFFYIYKWDTHPCHQYIATKTSVFGLILNVIDKVNVTSNHDIYTYLLKPLHVKNQPFHWSRLSSKISILYQIGLPHHISFFQCCIINLPFLPLHYRCWLEISHHNCIIHRGDCKLCTWITKFTVVIANFAP